MIIIVLGTGRSGTSTVSKLLHTKLDVHMGDYFIEETEANVGGTWEDAEFMVLAEQLLVGKISFKKFDLSLQHLINKRDREHELWGVKHPLITYVLGIFLGHLESFKIVNCTRELEKSISSSVKWYKWTVNQATAIIQKRKQIIENYKKFLDMVEINFDEQRSDKYILEKLQPVVGD